MSCALTSNTLMFFTLKIERVQSRFKEKMHVKKTCYFIIILMLLLKVL